MAASLWYQMKIGEDDRVSLPQIRTMLLFAGLEEQSVDALEVSIAEADNHLTGPNPPPLQKNHMIGHVPQIQHPENEAWTTTDHHNEFQLQIKGSLGFRV